MFKGQDSHVYLKAVSSRAEVVVDGPGALHFRTFGTNSAVDEAGSYFYM